MPLNSGIAMVGGDLGSEVQRKLTRLFAKIDKEVADKARERRLFPSQVKLLQPLHFCVLLGDLNVYVVCSIQNVGGMPRHQFANWEGKDMNLPTAMFLVQRDLSFEKPFGFEFSRSILDLPEDAQSDHVRRIGDQYIHNELLNLERLNRMVRINPIFLGRDFFLNDTLVFVLSPFSEPFNTIYTDHVRPTVQSIPGLSCIRADDIYDNRPIIEDIWKGINEARVVISELTGKNSNVFYETGIAHTVGKEVILLTQSMDDVPFDLRHLRCIVYDYTPRGVSTMETNLRNTISSILNRRR
jgi:hypothetical protein